MDSIFPGIQSQVKGDLSLGSHQRDQIPKGAAMAKDATTCLRQPEHLTNLGHQQIFLHGIGGPHLVNRLSVVEDVGDQTRGGRLRDDGRDLVAHVARVVEVVGTLDDVMQHAISPTCPSVFFCPMVAFLLRRRGRVGRWRSPLLGAVQMPGHSIRGRRCRMGKTLGVVRALEGIRNRGQSGHASKILRRMKREGNMRDESGVRDVFKLSSQA